MWWGYEPHVGYSSGRSHGLWHIQVDQTITSVPSSELDPGPVPVPLGCASGFKFKDGSTNEEC